MSFEILQRSAREEAEREGRAFCEWPPNPPIGQFKIEHGKGPDEADRLAMFLQRRFGLTEEDIFKNKRSVRSKVWDRTAMLWLALLTLDGKSEYEIAENFDSIRDVDSLVSVKTVSVLKSKYLTPLAMATAKNNREKTRKQFAVLFPENSQTECRLAKIEETLALPRQKIFNFSNGTLPNSCSGTYGLDAVVRMLYYKIVDRLEDYFYIQRVHASIEKKTGNESTTARDITVALSRLLSAEAKHALRAKMMRGLS